MKNSVSNLVDVLLIHVHPRHLDKHVRRNRLILNLQRRAATLVSRHGLVCLSRKLEESPLREHKTTQNSTENIYIYIKNHKRLARTHMLKGTFDTFLREQHKIPRKINKSKIKNRKRLSRTRSKERFLYGTTQNSMGKKNEKKT